MQVKVLPVPRRAATTPTRCAAKLEEAGIRVVLDDRDEKIGYKIREAQQVDRVPYMLILGAKEVEAGNISVRDRKGETTDDTVLLRRAAAVDLAESAGKVARVLKTALHRDFRHPQSRAAQQLRRALGALVAQILIRCRADHIVEAPQALAGADGRTGRDLLDRDILGECSWMNWSIA